jgi:DNA-binding MarR family transcriptional regulator
LLYGLVFPLFAIRGHLVELIEQACGDLDVVCTEAIALLHLANGSMTVTEISRAAGLQRSGGSVLVERLHERRFIKRSPDARDRRVVRVSLTARGGRMASALSERLTVQTPDLLAGLSPKERREILSGLKQLAGLRSDDAR